MREVRVWYQRVSVVVLVLVGIVSRCASAEAPVVSAEYRQLVPRRELALLHSPEVQQELQLSSKQLVSLETFFRQIDGHWLRARNLPLEKQQAVLDRIDQFLQKWLAKNVSPAQRQRLRQIEMQSQSVRMMLRNDLATALKLTLEQQEQFASLAKASDVARQELENAMRRGEDAEELQQNANAAFQAEQNALKAILTLEQHEELWNVLGRPFATANLTRLLPLAPEFVEVDEWINSKPLTLAELRGKVVLIHFYAFQCHNCHANFEIYRRWHEQWKDKGVVVVGIQTPETKTERDPAAVKAAALKEDLTFPIVIDLAGENWNAWANTMWPTVYVVDKRGYIRHWWQGELQWNGATGDQTIEQIVETVLAEP